MFIYGMIDDLYQKNVRFSKLKLFFSIRSIYSMKYGITQPRISIFLLIYTHKQQKKKAEGPTDPQQPAKKRPPTIPEATPPVAVGTTSGDPEALKQQIEAQGNKVRDLKSGGADKV